MNCPEKWGCYVAQTGFKYIDLLPAPPESMLLQTPTCLIPSMRLMHLHVTFHARSPLTVNGSNIVTIIMIVTQFRVGV